MGFLDYVVLTAVAVWFLAAVRSIVRKKGNSCCGSHCGAKSCCMCHKGE